MLNGTGDERVHERTVRIPDTPKIEDDLFTNFRVRIDPAHTELDRARPIRKGGAELVTETDFVFHASNIPGGAPGCNS